jgi:plasmid stabilization system protein ParE
MPEWLVMNKAHVNKPALIQAALARNDAREALRIAASFPHLGEHKAAITRGWEACQRPDFYRSLGKDPAELVTVGIAAVRARYAA